VDFTAHREMNYFDSTEYSEEPVFEKQNAQKRTQFLLPLV
jgi:hypothetical protein